MIFLHRVLKENKYKPYLIAGLLYSGLVLFAVLFLDRKFLPFNLAVALVYALTGYQMFRTGRISKYRKILFISFSFLFLAASSAFIWHSPDMPAAACPVSLASTAPALFRNMSYHLSAWHLFLPAALLLGAVLFAGRAWCSWMCPLGGVDEFFAGIGKKQVLPFVSVPAAVSELPAAILLFSALATLAGGSAFFCAWLCPYSLLHTLENPPALMRTVQVILVSFVGTAFLVIVPLLTKKRVFCRFICPLRGLLRLTGNLHPASLSLRKGTCIECGKCKAVCASLAIEPGYTVSPYCDFCLSCVEVCPAHAIETNPPAPAFLFISLLLGGMASLTVLSMALRVWHIL